MESSAVSGSILMIEEAVVGLRVSTCLYISHPSHFSDPVWVTLSFCFFQMSTGRSASSYIRGKDDRRRGDPNPRRLLKGQHERNIDFNIQ